MINITNARYITSPNAEGVEVNVAINCTINGINKSVPLDEANTDYQAIQEWIAEGGTVIDNGGGE